ncbi:MAG: YCF48-related protein, partial [Flavobacteriales bacterium]
MTPFIRAGLFLSACMWVLGAHAQWQAQTGVPNVDYYSVERYDAQTIHGGGIFSLLRSTNNGATWDTTYVRVGGVPFPGTLFDVHFISPLVGVASGLMSLGSQYAILRTIDGGQNWTVSYLSDTGGPLRWIRDIEFGSSTEGYAVGSDRRLLRTTNGGQTWTQLTTPYV